MIHQREDYNDIQKLDEKIPKDEPVFLLRAQDELSVPTIEHYISLRRSHYDASDEMATELEVFLSKVRAWTKKKKADV